VNDTDSYRMNPAEDTLLRGDQLADGMWVLTESVGYRKPRGSSEDDRIRRQRFRQVTGLRREPASVANGTPELVVFTGVWIDGYRETHTSSLNMEWIVKKAPTDAEAAAAARKVADMCRSAAELGLSPAWTAGPVFETDGGGAFTLMRNGRAYTVTVTPSPKEEKGA
jgi:hypothetical protein